MTPERLREIREGELFASAGFELLAYIDDLIAEGARVFGTALDAARTECERLEREVAALTTDRDEWKATAEGTAEGCAVRLRKVEATCAEMRAALIRALDYAKCDAHELCRCSEMPLLARCGYHGRVAELETALANVMVEPRLVPTDPEIKDFMKGVVEEVAFQRSKWSAHDEKKTDDQWFWLVGYLVGKALGKPEKRLHHLITAAAALYQWHSFTKERAAR